MNKNEACLLLEYVFSINESLFGVIEIPKSKALWNWKNGSVLLVWSFERLLI